MLYRILTPSWFYDVEVQDLQDLLDVLMEHDCAWHFNAQTICVWDGLFHDKKIRGNVEAALAEVATKREDETYVQKVAAPVVEKLAQIAVSVAENKVEAIAAIEPKPPHVPRRKPGQIVLGDRTKRKKEIEELVIVNPVKRIQLKRSRAEWDGIVETARRFKI